MHKAAPKFSDDLVVEGQTKKVVKRKSTALNDRATAVPSRQFRKNEFQSAF